MILVGGGGEGIHWERAHRPDNSDQTSRPAVSRGSDEMSRPGKAKPPGQTGIRDKTNVAGAKNNG